MFNLMQGRWSPSVASLQAAEEEGVKTLSPITLFRWKAAGINSILRQHLVCVYVSLHSAVCASSCVVRPRVLWHGIDTLVVVL